jgi:hypothetical protein
LAAFAASALWFRDKNWRLIGAITAGTAAALAVPLITYSAISGWSALADALLHRLGARAGLSMHWEWDS